MLDLVFYDGDQFPAEFKGQPFVALKGSWNRSQPTGYKVVRVPFKDGRPEGYYENFATGFWASGENRAEVWGRPAALAVAKDGSLLVADDTGGTIWRISFTGNQRISLRGLVRTATRGYRTVRASLENVSRYSPIPRRRGHSWSANSRLVP